MPQPLRTATSVPEVAARYLVDTSVWARLATTPEVAAALKSLVERASPDDVLVCPPVALECGFSARTGEHQARIMEQLAAFPECPRHPTRDEATRIQAELWNRGLRRAVGAMDTLIAAYAVKNNAIVVHYDRDFEHISSVVPELRHRWIRPRGSIA